MQLLGKFVFTLCVAFGNRIVPCRHVSKYNVWICDSVSKLKGRSVNGEIRTVYGTHFYIYRVQKTVRKCSLSLCSQRVCNCSLSSASFIQFKCPYCYVNMIFNIILLYASGGFSNDFVPFGKARRYVLQKWLHEAGNTAIYVNVVYVEYIRGLAVICIHVTCLG